MTTKAERLILPEIANQSRPPEASGGTTELPNMPSNGNVPSRPKYWNRGSVVVLNASDDDSDCDCVSIEGRRSSGIKFRRRRLVIHHQIAQDYSDRIPIISTPQPLVATGTKGSYDVYQQKEYKSSSFKPSNSTYKPSKINTDTTRQFEPRNKYEMTKGNRSRVNRPNSGRDRVHSSKGRQPAKKEKPLSITPVDDDRKKDNKRGNDRKPDKETKPRNDNTRNKNSMPQSKGYQSNYQAKDHQYKGGNMDDMRKGGRMGRIQGDEDDKKRQKEDEDRRKREEKDERERRDRDTKEQKERDRKEQQERERREKRERQDREKREKQERDRNDTKGRKSAGRNRTIAQRNNKPGAGGAKWSNITKQMNSKDSWTNTMYKSREYRKRPDYQPRPYHHTVRGFTGNIGDLPKGKTSRVNAKPEDKYKYRGGSGDSKTTKQKDQKKTKEKKTKERRPLSRKKTPRDGRRSAPNSARNKQKQGKSGTGKRWNDISRKMRGGDPWKDLMVNVREYQTKEYKGRPIVTKERNFHGNIGDLPKGKRSRINVYESEEDRREKLDNKKDEKKEREKKEKVKKEKKEKTTKHEERKDEKKEKTVRRDVGGGGAGIQTTKYQNTGYQSTLDYHGIGGMAKGGRSRTTREEKEEKVVKKEKKEKITKHEERKKETKEKTTRERNTKTGGGLGGMGPQMTAYKTKNYDSTLNYRSNINDDMKRGERSRVPKKEDKKDEDEKKKREEDERKRKDEERRRKEDDDRKHREDDKRKRDEDERKRKEREKKDKEPKPRRDTAKDHVINDWEKEPTRSKQATRNERIPPKEKKEEKKEDKNEEKDKKDDNLFKENNSPRSNYKPIAPQSHSMQRSPRREANKLKPKNETQKSKLPTKRREKTPPPREPTPPPRKQTPPPRTPTPKRQPSPPPRKESPLRRSPTPPRREPTPRKRTPTPPRRTPTPPRRTPTPPRRSPSPPRRSPSPPRRSPSPPRRSPTPINRMLSPVNEIPVPVPIPTERRRSVSPAQRRRRSPSPERGRSNKQRGRPRKQQQSSSPQRQDRPVEKEERKPKRKSKKRKESPEKVFERLTRPKGVDDPENAVKRHRCANSPTDKFWRDMSPPPRKRNTSRSPARSPNGWNDRKEIDNDWWAKNIKSPLRPPCENYDPRMYEEPQKFQEEEPFRKPPVWR